MLGNEIEIERLRAEVAAHPHPLLFATVSGAHLYGFPSADSDWDLRGCHRAPVEALLGLERAPETVRSAHVRDGAEIDLVTHEARKFLALLLRDNGYVLEQLFSPLVVHAAPGFEELREVARGCVTRSCVRHYLGFAATQWTLWQRDEPRRVKPLLYVYRVLLSGIALMRTGVVDASLPSCNATHRLPWIDELIARKKAGPEHGRLTGADAEFHAGQVRRLRAALVDAHAASRLPDTASPATRRAMHHLLLRLRGAA